METIYWSEHATTIGRMGLASTEGGLLAVLLPGELDARERVLGRLTPEYRPIADGVHNAEAARQLDEFTAGTRRTFGLTLDPRGTAFQRAVWDAVAAVPYGRTATYGELARRVGQPAAVRAVGAANGQNPLPLIVPCHRIVGSTGDLTGYGGGLPLKRALLALEGVLPGADESWTAWARRRLAEQPTMVIGPRRTGIYCRPDCRYTERLRTVPRIFADSGEAIAEGLRACRVCRPN